jgi:predicted HTH domain antitoxin
MKQLTLSIPENIDLSEKEAKRFLAAKMYESGKLSLGQAAELAGLSKIAFTELLGDYGVSLINYSASDILKDTARI